MAVEQRVIEKKRCRLLQQPARIGARYRQRAPAEQRPDLGGSLAASNWTGSDRGKELGDPVHDFVAGSPEFFRCHLEWGYAVCQVASLSAIGCRLSAIGFHWLGTCGVRELRTAPGGSDTDTDSR